MQEIIANPIIKEHLNHLKNSWGSTVVARSKFGDFSGGAYSAGYMANLDSKGQGPEDAFMFGNKKMYPVESAIKWLADRMKSVDQKYCNINQRKAER